MQYRSSSLRRAGWMIAIFGTGGAVILFLIFTWLSRKDDARFNVYVGWANVISMTFGAVGVIMVMIDKVGAIGNVSPGRTARVADSLAREALRQDGYLLAKLLSTEVLDSRPAAARFQIKRTARSKNSGKERSGNKVKRFDEIVNYYCSETQGRLVILGAPGAGKTVLAVTLSVGLLEQRAGIEPEQRQRIPVPCLLYMPSWNSATVDLEDWLAAQVANRFRLSEKIAACLVRDRLVLPILDGLDEMDSQEENSRRSQFAVSQVNDLIARTPGCKIVIVCRSGVKYYESLSRKISTAQEVVVQSLTAVQIVDYIRMQCPDDNALLTWQPVVDVLEGRGAETDAVSSELNTPWRLSAAVTFALRGGSPRSLLPTGEEIAQAGWRNGYSNRIGELLMEALISARITIHSKNRMSTALATQRLRTIARLLSGLERSKKGGAEIIFHEWWHAYEERKVRRTQVWAMYTGMHLPWAVFGFIRFAPVRGDKGLVTLLAVLVNYVTIQLWCYRTAVEREEPIALRLTSLRTTWRAVLACIGIMISGLFGWGWSFAYGPLYGVGFGAASAALMLLITASTGLDPVDTTRPMATLINDRNFAIIIGIAIGAYGMLYYVNLYGLELALVFSSMCVLGAILCSSYTRYLCAVYQGAKQGLPFRLARFLAFCHSAGLLRISGIGYQFRHRELFDYLSRQPIK